MLSTIHNRYATLTETERKLADRILREPASVVKMTARELSADCGTVPSAVVRFCKSVGAEGFADFKLRLSRSLGAKNTPALPLPVEKDDDARAVFRKVFASGAHTLADTLSMMDFSRTEAIVNLLQQASRIVFFGVGTSSVLAMDAQYRFAQLGLSTAACTDILFMNVTAANLKPGDVAVGISHSGCTKATVDALRRAKKAGAATVAVSSYAHSALASESDHCLIAFSDDQNYPVEAVSARIAHMCILDGLMMSLAARNFESLRDHISERNEVLGEIRYKER